MAFLEVKNVHTYYGHIHALKDLSLTVEKGEVVTLIGGNGAGKSTTLNTMSGLLKPRHGSIQFEGEELTRFRPHEIVCKGVVQVPEGRRVFGRLTVTENLEMGGYSCREQKLIKSNVDRVFVLFPRLEERRKQLAGTLSGGEQQMLAMARALLSNPKVLLMDEPSMGLAPVLVDRQFELIQEVNKRGTAIFVVEQNANMALSIANRGYVLQTGSIVLTDTAQNLLNNPMMKKAYLGGSTD